MLIKLNNELPKNLTLTERHQLREQIIEFGEGIGIKVTPLLPDEPGIDLRYNLAGNKHQILAIRLYINFLAENHLS